MVKNKFLDVESMSAFMTAFIETEFQRVLDHDISYCIDRDADLSFYLGYFQCAKELGVISEERFDLMISMIKDAFTIIWGNAPARQELHKKCE